MHLYLILYLIIWYVVQYNVDADMTEYLLGNSDQGFNLQLSVCGNAAWLN